MTEHARSRWPVVVSVATGTLLTGVTLGFGLASGIDWQQFVESYTLTNLVIGLAFLASGAPVAWLTRNVVGPLLIAAGLCHLISAAATMMAVFGLDAGWPTATIGVLSTLSNGPWQLGIGLLFPLALLLFPDGRLPSRRWAVGGLADRAERRFPGRDRSALRRVIVQRLRRGQLDPLHRARAAGGGRPLSQELLAMLRTCLSSARWCGASFGATSEPGAR